MIDNKLLSMLNDVESKGESLEPVSAMLNNIIYKDIGDWYERYTGKNIADDFGDGCAELLFFMFQHDNLDLFPAEHFATVLEELSNRYGVNAEEMFLFLQDYRKLLLD